MGIVKDFSQVREKGTSQGVLLPYQAKWVADTATVKVCEKSRRVGISWAEASDDALYAASESGDDVWYIGYNKDMAVEFISDAANWAKHYQLAASAIEEDIFTDEDKDILTYRITFKSGHRITALSSRPTNLRGKQGRVVIDEAAFHDCLAELIKAAMALTMWGGQVRVISTHDGVDNPFNELIEEIRASKRPYSLHRITLDDALGQGLYQRICQVLKREWSPEAEAKWRQDLIDLYGDAADEELFCVPSHSAGAYLSRDLIEKCMRAELPVLRYACPQGYELLPEWERNSETGAWLVEQLLPVLYRLDPAFKSYYGMDFGRNGDLSSIFVLQEDQKLRRSGFEIELRNVPFQQQKQILFFLLDRLPRFSGGANDATGIGYNLAEEAMQRYGASRIQVVKLSVNWYIENMPKLKAGFEDGLLEIPRDADILGDLRLIVMDKGVAKVPDDKRTKGADGKWRHGDSAVSLALAWWTTTLNLCGEPEVVSTGAKRAYTMI